MNTLETIRSRRSVRKYKEGADIPKEDLKQILEAAMMAPSACNTRPWEFVVLQDRDKLNALMKVHPYVSMLRTASLAIIVCAKPEVQEGICPGYFPQDCGAATQNILLAAKALGYGTCWCGVYPNEERIKAVQEVLGIDCKPYNVIALGVADEEPAARGFYDESRVTWM